MGTDYKVLVLNVAYEPVGVTSSRSVVKKLSSGKVIHVEEYYPYTYTTASNIIFQIPAVIRIYRYINVQTFVKKCFSKSNIYSRDKGACVYCGVKTYRLTIDHVMPRSRGGMSTYENMVTACIECNSKKGNRTPDEANMQFVTDIPKNYNPVMDTIRVMGAENELWSKFIT